MQNISSELLLNIFIFRIDEFQVRLGKLFFISIRQENSHVKKEKDKNVDIA